MTRGRWRGRRGRTQPGRRLRHQQPLGERRVGGPGRAAAAGRPPRGCPAPPSPAATGRPAPHGPARPWRPRRREPRTARHRLPADRDQQPLGRHRDRPPRAVRTTARTPSSTTSVSRSRAPVWLRALAVFFRVPLTGAAAALTELLTTLADTGIRPLRPFRPGAPSPERAYVDCAGPP
ncbi:hypothetical protein ACN24M_08390 [Streptomyces microflavus]